MDNIKTRFAPSPTGFMHIGNLRTCLYGYMFARRAGGKFLLRIEDTDRERYVDGAVDAILRTLRAAGIEYDEGPGKDRGNGPYVQSERGAIYKEYAERLVATGDAYYCFCSEERLLSLDSGDGVKKYDKHCLKLDGAEVKKRIAAGEPYVIRQNMPTSGVSEYDDAVYGHISVPCADMEDNVLLKSDGMPTYNFANVIDDHLMGITHVIRGNEYLSSTPKYNLIYDSFGWRRPRYIHLAPIMRDAEHKLSKRYGDANFEDFTAKGYLAEAVVNYIALLGWSPKDNSEKMTLAEMTEKFSLSGLSKSGSIFDEAKMRWLNGEYIKDMTDEAFLAAATPWLNDSAAAGGDYALLTRLLKGRTEVFSEIPEKLEFLRSFERYDVALFENRKMKVDLPLAKTVLAACAKALPAVSDWRDEPLKLAVGELSGKLGVKPGQVFVPLRLALTGVPATPGGATEVAELLGKAESLRRLNASIEFLC